jgi:hypothetical protein
MLMPPHETESDGEPERAQEQDAAQADAIEQIADLRDHDLFEIERLQCLLCRLAHLGIGLHEAAVSPLSEQRLQHGLEIEITGGSQQAHGLQALFGVLALELSLGEGKRKCLAHSRIGLVPQGLLGSREGLRARPLAQLLRGRQPNLRLRGAQLKLCDDGRKGAAHRIVDHGRLRSVPGERYRFAGHGIPAGVGGRAYDRGPAIVERAQISVAQGLGRRQGARIVEHREALDGLEDGCGSFRTTPGVHETMS